MMMKIKKYQKKAQLSVWLYALLFLFMISLVYIIMTKPYIAVRDMFEPNFTGTQFEETFNKINTFWVLWPVLVIVGVFIWAIFSSINTGPSIPRL